MKRPGWLGKLLWLLPLVLIVLAGAALLAVRAYLSSDRATREVAARLQDLLGGRVEIRGAQIGLTGDLGVQGIEAFDAAHPDKPWLQIERLTADVSALSLLREKSPQAIQLEGARIALRFSSAGHLQTQLPSHKKEPAAPLPRLHIEQGELTLDQEGQRPMVLHGINADIVPDDKGGMKLIGTITDPFWGHWTATGDFDTTGGSGGVTLNTPGVAVTMEMLQSIAFVPPKVWRQVQIEGTTPARVQLRLQTGSEKPRVHYRVEIAPRDARVHVASIELDARQTSGKAVVEDELVILEDVKGQVARGAIETSGNLNFRAEPTRMDFKVGVRDVVLRDLPRSWKLPKSIDGHLSGAADLSLTIDGQGKVRTAGSGQGTITEASWGGIRIKRPIRLAMHSDGRRFHFRQPKPAAIAPEEQDLHVHAEGSVERDALPDEAGDLLASGPARVAKWMGDGLRIGVEQISRGVDKSTRFLAKVGTPPKPNEAPTYVELDLGLEDVDLAKLLDKLKLRLPYAIAGRLTFQVHASIPINTPGEMKAYRLRGTAKLPRFRIAGLDLTRVEARVRYADGRLDLDDLHGQAPQPKAPEITGHFAGSAHVQVIPQGELSARLTIQEMPVDVVLSLLPSAANKAAGTVSGSVQGHAPLAKLRDPANWHGSATLTAPSLQAYGLKATNAALDVNVDRGRAVLKSFRADLAGTPLTGEGELRLSGAYPFKGELHLGRTDLAALNRLEPSFRPPIAIKGRAQLNGSLSGTLNPLRFDTKGEVKAQDFTAEGFKVDKLSLHWSKAKNGLKLEDIDAELYGGRVTGSAVVPLQATAEGAAKLRLRELDVQALTKSLPSFPIHLQGKVSGTITGELAKAKNERPRAWTTDLELTAPRLRVQGVPAERLKGSIDSQGGKTSYSLQGETLGGKFSIKGDWPTREKTNGKDKPVGQGRLKVEGARLSRLWSAYRITGALSELGGTFFIDLPYRHEGPDYLPRGNGTFRIINVRWDGTDWSDGLQGEVRLTPDELFLNNVTGDFGQGVLMGDFAFGLRPGRRSWFDIDLQQVDASQLFVPLPTVAAHVKGPIDATLRGRIGPEWHGTGNAVLTRGQIYGLDISEWRVPLRFSFSPTQGTGDVTTRDSQAQIAQGRAKVNAELHWNNGVRLHGNIVYYQVDLRTLLRHSPELSSYASGRVAGRIDLAGNDMHSMNDLTAQVEAKLQQSQALQMPVLRQITPYLRPGVSSATFQSGQLKGRLAGGVFRIQHFTLVGRLLQLIIEGTVNLAGNLNLEVTAQTGIYALNPSRAANLLGARLPLVGAIPRLLLNEISSLLAQRVVHLRVTGNIRNPIIRLEPILLLTEETVRFFLGRLAGVSSPTVP